MAIDATLLERTLELPERQRAELARKLILSLEPPDFDADSARLWAKEIKARIARVENGEARLVDWRSSVKRIRRSLRGDARK